MIHSLTPTQSVPWTVSNGPRSMIHPRTVAQRIASPVSAGIRRYARQTIETVYRTLQRQTPVAYVRLKSVGTSLSRLADERLQTSVPAVRAPLTRQPTSIIATKLPLQKGDFLHNICILWRSFPNLNSVIAGLSDRSPLLRRCVTCLEQAVEVSKKQNAWFNSIQFISSDKITAVLSANLV